MLVCEIRKIIRFQVFSTIFVCFIILLFYLGSKKGFLLGMVVEKEIIWYSFTWYFVRFIICFLKVVLQLKIGEKPRERGFRRTTMCVEDDIFLKFAHSPSTKGGSESVTLCSYLQLVKFKPKKDFWQPCSLVNTRPMWSKERDYSLTIELRKDIWIRIAQCHQQIAVKSTEQLICWVCKPKAKGGKKSCLHSVHHFRLLLFFHSFLFTECPFLSTVWATLFSL